LSPVVWIAVAGGVVLIGLLVWWFRPGRSCRHDCSEQHYVADSRDPFRRWVQGVMALYRGNAGDPAYWDRPCAQRQAGGWSLETPADLAELLERYRAGEVNVAFDKSRIIWLARLGQGMGWLDEQQSWQWCHYAASELVQRYPSWNAVYQDIDQGRMEWYGGQVPPEQRTRAREDFQFAMTKVLPQITFR
jgi:hypothetical protein